MKNVISFFLILLIAFFTGCSNENTTNPPSANEDSGKMLLKFDRTTAPANVASVTAYLTRQGFSTITGNMNIAADTTASISLNSIATGQWHLTVEAKDNSGIVTYKGESDVTISAGLTTQVSLTLQPTSGNVGGIYIFVQWGAAQTNWLDCINNPIFKMSNSSFDNFGVTSPHVIIEENKYKMWFHNQATIPSIGYAESPDGYNWTRPSSQPVINLGSSGTWDCGYIQPGPVINVDGQYWMYYSGSAVSGMESSRIGLAVSTDGIHWTKRANPVLLNQSGWESSVIASEVIKINNTFYLYYTGRQYPVYKIGLATSSDGINWARHSGNPILSADQTWEGSGVFNPSVIKDGNRYVMVYGNLYDEKTALGMAVSEDGIHWTKENSNPFFTYNNTANHWINYIQYPCLRVKNNEWRIYYSGWDSVKRESTIAVAVKTN